MRLPGKTAAEGLRAAKDKDACRREHVSKLILHDAAVRVLRKLRADDGKVASFATQKVEHAKLTMRGDFLKTEYTKLKSQAEEYGAIKRNVQRTVNPTGGKREGKR